MMISAGDEITDQHCVDLTTAALSLHRASFERTEIKGEEACLESLKYLKKFVFGSSIEVKLL